MVLYIRDRNEATIIKGCSCCRRITKAKNTEINNLALNRRLYKRHTPQKSTSETERQREEKNLIMFGASPLLSELQEHLGLLMRFSLSLSLQFYVCIIIQQFCDYHHVPFYSLFCLFFASDSLLTASAPSYNAILPVLTTIEKYIYVSRCLCKFNDDNDMTRREREKRIAVVMLLVLVVLAVVVLLLLLLFSNDIILRTRLTLWSNTSIIKIRENIYFGRIAWVVLCVCHSSTWHCLLYRQILNYNRLTFVMLRIIRIWDIKWETND